MLPEPAAPRHRRRLTVTFTDSRHCAYVHGHGSRELLTEMRGRSPLWSSLTRAWATTERTARDLIAVAEARGFEVMIEREPGVKPLTPGSSETPVTGVTPESTVPQGERLW